MIRGSAIVRRKEAKKGIRLTIMIVGESGTGKTTFVNSLLDQKILDHKYQSSDGDMTASAWERTFLPQTAHEEPGISITETNVEIIDEDDSKLLLNIIDTPGFGENINNEVCTREVINYLKQQFDLVLAEETKVRRNPKFVDSRVHVCLYFITPTGHGLREIDVECMKKLLKYVNVLPVVARADSFTEVELRRFKRTIMEDIEKYNVPIFEFTYDEEEDDYDVIQEIEFLNKIQPFAVIASEEVFTREDGTQVRGRQYPWGFINIDDAKYSDFPILKSVLLGSHLQDLKDLTHDFLYENYRTERLSNVGGMQFEDDNANNLLPRDFSFMGNPAREKPPPSLSNLAALANSELTTSMLGANSTRALYEPSTPTHKSSMLFDDVEETSGSPATLKNDTSSVQSRTTDDSRTHRADTSQSSVRIQGVYDDGASVGSASAQPQRQQMRMMSETIPYVLNHERIEQQKLKLQQLEERQVRELQMRADMLERKAKELRLRERTMNAQSEQHQQGEQNESAIKKEETLTDLHSVLQEQ
ncbi:hypothetical protein BABINDRAFT_29672 [Babjeviella inositovora NRRL Y-12698]|uniref:Septin-type G domain-containing protein n=1 Tax=Babjeviella inositovora NRRL Y-12698 TaxID=984486 RepID=A0A1E3R0A4_9ASCO|nr:uncharacterized protein BABINDRAFT_29672 [Babjeviella inositovora NRRL Y-12698]ODQ82797.1 hypothetical protein BABINDRAFT_29672 [Babjeviella inositovora NRRL Y-12698]